MEKTKGAYLGTEVGGKWWKRCAKDNLLVRGNGEYWFDDQGLYFLRYFTKEPIFIPSQAIKEVKIGRMHSGRWAMGIPILKILWTKEGVNLSSGFISKEEKAPTFKDNLLKVVKKS
jgi:hypothetical protein